MQHRVVFLILAAVGLAAQPAAAYVGPGAGLSLIGSVVGLLAAIGTALGFVLFWPVRALYRRMKGRRPGDVTAPGAPGAGQPPDGDRGPQR
jgi:hypothetical protein